jgi:primosomal protein N' (replication factor Y)
MPAFDVAIGTEAVLHRAPTDASRPIRLVAFLDVDQELLAPRHRAEEQALWLLVRAARRLGDRSGGGTVLVQTRMPDHPVLVAALDGDPTAVLDADRARRHELGYPPFGGLAELSGDAAAVEVACAALSDSGLTVLGPRDRRALVRAPSIDELCDALAIVDLTPARAAGRLRVDVDPRRV